MRVVVGCGNLARSDDGVGVVVARRLAGRFPGGLPAGVAVFDAGTDGMATMFHARGATELVVVDACRSGSEPGAVFEVPGRELEAPPDPGLGLHGFRWEHALHAGRRILREAFPTDVSVFLIEAASVDFGTELTEVVSRAADLVVDRLAARLAGPAAPGCELQLVRGSLRVPRAACDAWFAGVEAVVLLRDGDDLLVLPVRHLAGGGHLLKVLNAAGDRVVSATDFFRTHDAEADRTVAMTWDPARAALVGAGFFGGP